jgi:large subunit ribosomal protein L22
MGKQKHERSLADHEAQAILSNVRVSPRKLNLVAAMIRNLPAQRAIATLTFSKRRIAHQVRKTLESAIANAENNHQLNVDNLVVTRAEVGSAIVMRRFHARGRGRSAQIEKWFSHMKIVVAEKQDAVEAPVRARRGASRAMAAPVSALIPDVPPPSAIPDHVAVEATMALPPTVDDEGEAAEQALSDDQVAGQAPVAEHVTSAAEATTEDHAHTEATLSVPSTVDDEGEAAEQALSADAADASDKAAEEHATPPDHSGPESTGGAA